MELKSSEVFLGPSAGWHFWGRFLTHWKSTIPVFPRQICSLRSPRRCAVEKEQRQAGWMAVRGHTLPALSAPTFLPKSSRFEPCGSRGTKPDGWCLFRQRSLPALGSHVRLGLCWGFHRGFAPSAEHLSTPQAQVLPRHGHRRVPPRGGGCGVLVLSVQAPPTCGPQGTQAGAEWWGGSAILQPFTFTNQDLTLQVSPLGLPPEEKKNKIRN